MTGLINKFYVHGFSEKAKRLEMLVDKFISSKKFKDHEEVLFYFLYDGSKKHIIVMFLLPI